jgi:hypothetical protein
MKIAISQPTFFPWLGYFALIDYVDEFIFLDTVQFDKRSWQQRNYIKLNENKHLITIPVISKNKFNQKINEVKIDYSNFQMSKFLKTIESAYKKSYYFDLYFDVFKEILNKEYIFLSQLNLDIILTICKLLKIKNKFSEASSFHLDSYTKKIHLLDSICKQKKTLKYISTLGSLEYLGELKILPESKASINYFYYKISNYKQLGDKFISNLSIIDLLFNEGPGSTQFLRNNFEIKEN